MTDVTHLPSGAIDEYAAEINRQRGKQQAPKDWEAGFNKGAKIGRNIAQQRGHRIPDQTTGSK